VTEAKPAKAVNISQQAKLQRGDLAKGFAESDVVIERRTGCRWFTRAIWSLTPLLPVAPR